MINEVQATSKADFPEAAFKGYHGVDAKRIHIDAYTKANDGFAVLDRVSDRLVDQLMKEELDIYVVPLPQAKT